MSELNNDGLFTLTRDGKRVRIAEACGWTAVVNFSPECSPFGFSPEGDYGRIPDYFRSLDAMHEALKWMNRDQCHNFNRLIMELRGDIPLENDGRLPQSLRWSWGQPAEIMAEAFGRALNLW